MPNLLRQVACAPRGLRINAYMELAMSAMSPRDNHPAATPESSGYKVDPQIARQFNAPAERVFDAWLDPGVGAHWPFATPGGQTVRAQTDARVGGRFVFTDRRDGVDVEHSGAYLEIARPRRLVFEFSVPMYSPGVSRIAVDLEPAPGGCGLTLTHVGHPAEFVERSRAGWNMTLDRLAATLAQAAPCGAGAAATWRRRATQHQVMGVLCVRPALLPAPCSAAPPGLRAPGRRAWRGAARSGCPRAAIARGSSCARR